MTDGFGEGDDEWVIIESLTRVRSSCITSGFSGAKGGKETVGVGLEEGGQVKIKGGLDLGGRAGGWREVQGVEYSKPGWEPETRSSVTPGD